MFEELRELADTVREHAPRIGSDWRRGATAIVLLAEAATVAAEELPKIASSLAEIVHYLGRAKIVAVLPIVEIEEPR